MFQLDQFHFTKLAEKRLGRAYTWDSSDYVNYLEK